MNSNEQLIHSFYSAFEKGDYIGMQACYADEVVFNDEAFLHLNAKETKAMWHMLLQSGLSKLTFNHIKANEYQGSAHWVAEYTLSVTGRFVVNRIDASFEFQNGKIIRHTDHFNFYLWARQAFGPIGILIGWTPFFKNKVRKTARARLDAFILKHPQYQ